MQVSIDYLYIFKQVYNGRQLYYTFAAQSIVQDTCVGQENEVRLVQTPSINLLHAGRVEICINEIWSPICNNPLNGAFWGVKNAQVVCKQLGYSGTLNSINGLT